MASHTEVWWGYELRVMSWGGLVRPGVTGIRYDPPRMGSYDQLSDKASQNSLIIIHQGEHWLVPWTASCSWQCDKKDCKECGNEGNRNWQHPLSPIFRWGSLFAKWKNVLIHICRNPSAWWIATYPLELPCCRPGVALHCVLACHSQGVSEWWNDQTLFSIQSSK